MVPLIWNDQPGAYFCIATKSDDRWHNEFFRRGEVADYVRSQEGKDVYFAPNGFRSPRRTKESAVRGHWLYADLDAVKPQSLDLEPTIAIRTSPGRYQAFWKCDDIVDDDLAKRLVYHVGADRDSWARNKVLRVPGTFNHKRDKLARVRLLWDDGPTYRLARLQRLLPSLRAADTVAPVRGSRGTVSALIERYAHVRVGSVPLRSCLRVCGPSKRSSLIFGIVVELLKTGASRDEACAVARSSWAFQSRAREKGDQYMEDDLRNILEKLL